MIFLLKPKTMIRMQFPVPVSNVCILWFFYNWISHLMAKVFRPFAMNVLSSINSKITKTTCLHTGDDNNTSYFLFSYYKLLLHELLSRYRNKATVVVCKQCESNHRLCINKTIFLSHPKVCNEELI